MLFWRLHILLLCLPGSSRENQSPKPLENETDTNSSDRTEPKSTSLQQPQYQWQDPRKPSRPKPAKDHAQELPSVPAITTLPLCPRKSLTILSCQSPFCCKFRFYVLRNEHYEFNDLLLLQKYILVTFIFNLTTMSSCISTLYFNLV